MDSANSREPGNHRLCNHLQRHTGTAKRTSLLLLCIFRYISPAFSLTYHDMQNIVLACQFTMLFMITFADCARARGLISESLVADVYPSLHSIPIIIATLTSGGYYSPFYQNLWSPLFMSLLRYCFMSMNHSLGTTRPAACTTRVVMVPYLVTHPLILIAILMEILRSPLSFNRSFSYSRISSS